MASRSHNPTTVLLPHQAMRNIYVRELGRAYASLGVEPIYGSANLFESGLVPDLVHLNWPEEVYRSPQEGSVGVRVERFLSRLDRLIGMGTRLIWTVHNLAPHEVASAGVEQRAYQGVVDRAHVVHHHGEDSEHLLRSRYRIPAGQAHIIVPHGHYFGYPNTMTRSQARALLGLDESNFVYLHFGQIRGYKGLDVVEKAFGRLGVRHKHLLVAGALGVSQSRMDRLWFFTRRKLGRDATYVLKVIRNDDVQRYLQACDAVVLGHTTGLNSGVAVLGMTFGKPVVGPRLGCIEWTLEQGTNVLYDPGDVRSLKHAMEEVTRLDPATAGAHNREVAAGWTWEAIAQRAIEACRQATRVRAIGTVHSRIHR